MRKALVLLLLLVPFIVNAECDKSKHEEYNKLSNSITYDNNYIKDEDKFSVTIYNIFDGMYVMYNNARYNPNADNEVIINNIDEGSSVIIDIYGNDGCSQIRRILINEPYYNEYYGSNKCIEYVDKLVMCSSQFTNTEVTESRLDNAIYNYTHDISQKTKKDVANTQTESLFDRAKDFLLNWGVKIVLLVVTTGITIAIYSNKYRKVKHGI